MPRVHRKKGNTPEDTLNHTTRLIIGIGQLEGDLRQVKGALVKLGALVLFVGF